MDIVITGSRGFIGSNLAKAFVQAGHRVLATDRSTLNPLDSQNVIRFFEAHQPDVLIQCASTGGRRLYTDTDDECYKNLLIFENLIAYSNCKLFFNFGSGAEFDRRYPVNQMKEDQIYERTPVDAYGLAKNIIAKRIRNIKGAFTLRLFNAFGPNELPKRLVSTALGPGSSMTVVNKWMDFFYIGDLFTVVQWCIDHHEVAPSDINCVYPEKYRLEDVVRLASQKEITVEGPEEFYTGDGSLLQSLGIPLMGLQAGLAAMRSTQ